MAKYNGALDLVIVPEMGGKWFYSGSQLFPEEWEDLYGRVLGVSSEIYQMLENEPYDVFDTRTKRLFQDHVKARGFESLSRISDIYADAEFASGEIGRLLKECEALILTIAASPARAGLKKLITSCKIALEKNAGILLSSD